MRFRPGRANANDAADNIAVLREALSPLPADGHRRVLVCTDAAAGTHAFLQAVTEPGRPRLGLFPPSVDDDMAGG